ncbi:MAG: glycosyltransferase family 2 protein [Spirochaetes bacterium]|nr:glycosyltransferase family 2 protein [Spirochaetota bacterium]
MKKSGAKGQTARGRQCISILTPCYNESQNVVALSAAVAGVMARLPDLDYEHVFIDNCSTDETPALLRGLAAKDRRVKLIFNARNFGHVRSPFHGLLQCRGDAVIQLVADFQDPPELILEFVKHWRRGAKIVIGVKTESEESRVMYALRHLYYRLIRNLGEFPHVDHFTGFGLYDQCVIEALRSFDDPIPYLRGMIAEIGFDRVEVPYLQPRRKGGRSKNNFLTLFDFALLGFVNNSRVPLRLAVFLGLFAGGASFAVGLFYLVYKILFWDRFQVGSAPIVIGLFFFASVQLFFTGIVGEYIGAIHTQVKKRPRVIERERVNWAKDDSRPVG